MVVGLTGGKASCLRHFWCSHRDNPGREVTLTIQRGDQKPFPLSVTPDLAKTDNGGVIGVKLGNNAMVGVLPLHDSVHVLRTMVVT
jgi:hypothetical protein